MDECTSIDHFCNSAKFVILGGSSWHDTPAGVAGS